jgi:hypothetical protein
VVEPIAVSRQQGGQSYLVPAVAALVAILILAALLYFLVL